MMAETAVGADSSRLPTLPGESAMPEPSPIPFPARRAFLRRTLAAAAVGPLALDALAWSQAPPRPPSPSADAFLAEFVRGWLPLSTAASEAAWVASTDVSEAHTADQIAKQQALNEFIGSPTVIETVRTLLSRDELEEYYKSKRTVGAGDMNAISKIKLNRRQLEKVRLRSAESPGTIPDVVRARTEAEAKQSATQDGFMYTLE